MSLDRASTSSSSLSRRRVLAAATWAVVGSTCVGRVFAQRLMRLGPLEPDGRVPYFIAAGESKSGYRAADVELAEWALGAWQQAAGGALSLVRIDDERAALVRLYWADAAGGQYGEMLGLDVGGRRGAAVFVRPDTTALGEDIAARATADELFRDVIVYLTCLHELGHALGLAHTDEFADIMYFFGYGGDVLEYFDRYRRRLRRREDIKTTSAISTGDLEQLHALYER